MTGGVGRSERNPRPPRAGARLKSCQFAADPHPLRQAR